MVFLLGIDVGSTVIKAVIFDLKGNELNVASRKLPIVNPAPGQIEVDADLLWNHTKDVIKQCLNNSKVHPDEIIGMSVSGFGDSLFFLDKDGKPVRNPILDLDKRGAPIIKYWEEKKIMEEIFPIIGQKPFASGPLSILAWMKRKEKENYHKIRWLIFCKDFIKYKLTNVICTDETDPSAGFIDVKERRYSDKIFELLDIEECKDKLPEIVPGHKICGEITAHASDETGLKKKMTVASGLHDIDATAFGSGCLEHGQILMIVGTWGINEVIINKPLLDPMKRCFTRTYVTPNRWVLMSTIPSSASNLEWFIKECCGDERVEAEMHRLSPYAICDMEIKDVPEGAGGVIYHPFLYGLIDKPNAKAGFYGITAWHTRAHLLRAVYEGVAFANRMQIEHFKRIVNIEEARIAGGGAKSKIWTQIFADVMQYPIKVPNGTELGARGASMCAGIAAGVYKDHKTAVEEATSISHIHIPLKASMEKYKYIYKIFKNSLKNASKMWDIL